MTSPLTVLTMLKVGSSPNGELHGERPFWRQFGDQYLTAWLAGVRKYIPDPKRIVVMTDVPLRIADVHNVETVKLDMEVNAPGFWAKTQMFAEGVSTGKSLWLDLDNVLCGDLSALCALTPDPLVMMDDRHIPGLPNGSTILFDAERCRELWEAYAYAKTTLERTYVAKGDDYSLAYDQAYIADWYRTQFGHPVPFFQEMLPLGYVLNAYSELPKSDDWRSAHLIFGCGAAGKPHVMKHQVFRDNWASV